MVNLRTKFLIGLSAILIVGCAMEQRGTHINFKPDLGEFGEVIGKFQLADGSEGKLRRDVSGNYSIKLSKYLKVVPLNPSPRTAKIIYSSQVGHQTAILIETSSNKCEYGYQLYAFVGKDVKAWHIGNCKTLALVSEGDSELFIDFDQGVNVRRYKFADDKLRAGTFRTAVVRATTNPITNSTQNPSGNVYNDTRGTQEPYKTRTNSVAGSQDNLPTVGDSSSTSKQVPRNGELSQYPPPPGVTPSAASSAEDKRIPTRTSASSADKAKKSPSPRIPDLVFGESEEKPTRRIVLTD